MIKLYKFNGFRWVLVDFGVRSKVETYCALGYMCQF